MAPLSNRHSALRVSFSAIVAIIGLSLSMLTFAEEAPGTITIEQRNGFSDTLGSWLLLTPDGEHREGGGIATTLENITPGIYTLIVNLPNGMTASIRKYHGSEELEYVQRPQLTFALAAGEAPRLVIHYNLTRTGTIAVNSDPAGLSFELKGPDGIIETGTTPASYENFPEGLYQLQFDTIEGCVVPPRKSDQLTVNGRISFKVKISCAAADKIRSRQQNKGTEFVVVQMGTEEVTLRDVLQSAWYASHVFNVARKGVITGYRDAHGRFSGEFGPGNLVSVAELAAIAHRLIGVSSDAFKDQAPDNPRAVRQWFSPFIASAEARGWTIYNDATIDPLRPATRAEVLVTLLQALDVSLQWQKGNVFTDVTARTHYAAAIETAARDKVIEGRKDASGKPLNLFEPTAPINRAEISKVIDTIFSVYR